MKITNKLSLVFLMLVMTTVTFAQNYKIEKEIFLCDISALPVDLGTQVLGVDASATGGQWREVDSKDNSKVLNPKAKNVLKAIDLTPGDYTFIYKANSNNPCAEEGEEFKAVVHILETPKPVNIAVPLCEGDTRNIDLKTLISATLKDKYNIAYKEADGSVIPNGILAIGATETEAIKATYEITGVTNANYPCTLSADIAIDVTREADYLAKNYSGEKTFCIDKMPKKLNLKAELGISVDIDWTTPSGAPTINDGVIDFENATQAIAKGVYTYSFVINAPNNKCGLDKKKGTYTLTITDDLTDKLNKEKEKAICKVNTPNANIDMFSTLGISIPIQSGVWEAADAATPEDYIKDGFFDASKAPTGTYKYQFRVSNAADLCGIAGKTSGILTFIIENGGDLLDGTLQLCMANLPTDINLSKYISGMTNANTTWSDAQGNVVAGGTLDASSLKKGTYQYTYETGSSDCKSTGALYISVVDKLSNFTDRTVKYCLTDTGSDTIDLDGLLAVGGVKGIWSGTGATNANYDGNTHVFNGRTAGAGTYTFTFTADSGAGCSLANQTATITVIMTDDLAQ